MESGKWFGHSCFCDQAFDIYFFQQVTRYFLALIHIAGLCFFCKVYFFRNTVLSDNDHIVFRAR